METDSTSAWKKNGKPSQVVSSSPTAAVPKLLQMQRPLSNTGDVAVAKENGLASPRRSFDSSSGNMRNHTLGIHPLKYTWTFWCMYRPPGKGAGNATNYSAANKKIASFSSVEDFWAIYAHLVRSSKLTPTTTYSLFRHPITPTWEHPSHLSGGKWSAHLRKHLSARLWEQLLLALIGDAFSDVGEDEVTGITLSVKNGEDVLSIWNRHGKDGRKGLGIKRILKDVVGMTVNWEYTVFEEIRDKNGNGEKTEK